MNIAAFDLNLLRVFDALMAERHVTRAGERLGLSQPAVSGALARLRHAFDDELFVREGHAMAPTPRALELAEPVRDALRRVELALASRDRFDPGAAHRGFTLLAPDYVSFLLIPPLIARLAEEAPGVDLRLLDIMHGPAGALLETGRVDVAVDVVRSHPVAVNSRFLMRDRYAVITRADGPAAAQIGTDGVLPVDVYCRLGHVLHSLEGATTGTADAALAAVGRTRRVALSLPHFVAIARTVAATDLIATYPRRLAGALAPVLGLTLAEPPLDLGPIALALAWHRRADGDAGHRWLRDRIAATAAAIDATEEPVAVA